jgi:hypothetical protein
MFFPTCVCWQVRERLGHYDSRRAWRLMTAPGNIERGQCTRYRVSGEVRVFARNVARRYRA